MQTLGHIYLFDREGNQTACVQVLYRIAKHNSYLKLRRPSKNMGVHFEGEEISLQQSRFSSSYICDVSEEDAEAIYQDKVESLLKGESIGF